MKFLPRIIFSEFTDKILDESYYPIHPLETLKAHLTAAWLLQQPNPDIIAKTEAFISKTTAIIDTDVSRLKKLASETLYWDELKICSAYTNTMGTFLEYKLFLTDHHMQQQVLHFHAGYKFNLGRCFFISETPPLIRVAGDPVLQQPGALYPDNPTLEEQLELSAQIELAKSVLIQTSGAGIAANQCAGIKNPYRFTIVGVFYESVSHVEGVEKRYPGTKFPQAKIMLNPVITSVSKDMQQFNHACLSVPCGNRCAVLSPVEIRVKYKDPLDKMAIKEASYKGIDAVVLWHELTHILDGKTYLDVTFEALSEDQLLKFFTMLNAEIKHRLIDSQLNIPELSVPPFHLSVKINAEGIPQLDSDELAAVLPKMTDETLSGLLSQANLQLKKKCVIESDKPPRITHTSFFSLMESPNSGRDPVRKGFMQAKL